MLLGLCLICVTLVGWGLVATVTKPANRISRQRDLDRRFRQLRHHPERVNFLDVENLMLSESIPVGTVARVMTRVASHRIGARTMWRWAAAHGTSRLVMVIDASVAEDTLLDHLDAGTAPDWTTMTVFARRANDTLPAGMPIDELGDLDAVQALDDLNLSFNPTFLDDLTDRSATSLDSLDPLELLQFESLPPIADPGLTPFGPLATGDDGDGDWPVVA